MIKYFLQKITVHPEYSSASVDHDIALLELEESVEFRESLKPVCLDTGDDEMNNDELHEFTIFGFRILDNSDWLQRVTVKEIPFNTCSYKYGILNRQNFICTSGENYEMIAESCKGGSRKFFLIGKMVAIKC